MLAACFACDPPFRQPKSWSNFRWEAVEELRVATRDRYRFASSVWKNGLLYLQLHPWAPGALVVPNLLPDIECAKFCCCSC